MTISRSLLLLLFVATLAPASTQTPPFIIAHRGASGYLPEHTLEAATLAHAQGANFIEQDVVMTRDNVLIVLHDIHLDTTTDVASQHPERHRKDGRYYAVDFDWSEVRKLRVRERFDHQTGQAVFPGRFSRPDASFRICTVAEQLELIVGLNQSTHRNVGICPEIKAPAWHHAAGKDVGVALINLLNRHEASLSSVVVQCFEPAELKRLRATTQTQLPFVQLIGLNSWGHEGIDYEQLLSLDGLREIATYANAIGPHLDQIMVDLDQFQSPQFSNLVENAHSLGLKVIPYTLRKDSLPPHITTPDDLLKIFLSQANIDGIFTDHPDSAVDWITQHYGYSSSSTFQ